MKKLGYLIWLLTSWSASAQTTFFCTHSNQLISVGDELNKVKLRCGEPSNENKKTFTPTQRVVLDQWFYEEKPLYPSLGGTPPSHGIIFSFKGNRLVEINENGLKRTSIACPLTGTVIKTGVSKTQVRQFCGAANHFGQSQSFTHPPKEHLITWTYDNGPYQGKTTLQFKDGKLEHIQHGSNP